MRQETEMASKILLIEQDKKAAATLRNYFRGTGLAVERVRGLVEALTHLSMQSVDLILLNLIPPGRPGFEFVKTLRNATATRNLPIIITTSVYRGADYAHAARDLGVADYLETPFTTASLVKAVRRALGTITTVAMPIHRHLRRAFLSGFSGIYTIKSPTGDKHLVFFEGVPVHLSPGFFYPDFGRYLRHHGLISVPENCFLNRSGTGLYDRLVQMGCFEHPELVQDKLRYLTEELIAAFGHAPATVVEQPFQLPSGMQPIGVNVPDIFHQGYRCHADLPNFRRRLDSLKYRYLSIDENFYRFINFLNLDEWEKQFLKKLDGTYILRECLYPCDDLEPLVLTLYALNMICFSERPVQIPAPGFPLRLRFNSSDADTPSDNENFMENFRDFVNMMNFEAEIPEAGPSAEEPTEILSAAEIQQLWEGLQGKNYYQLFGLSPEEFSVSKLKDRYFDYTHKLDPGVLLHLSSETAALAQQILQRITTSYNILVDDLKRAHYDKLLERDETAPEHLAGESLQARVQAYAGEIHLNRNDWDSAEKAFQEACNLEPFNGEWLAHLAWTIYRNPNHNGSRVRRERSKRMINRALGLKSSAQGHTYRGWMLFEEEQLPAAKEEFTQALKLDPYLDMARKGLKAAKKNLPKSGDGWFHRFFSLP